MTITHAIRRYVDRTDSVEQIQRLLEDSQRFVENTSSV